MRERKEKQRCEILAARDLAHGGRLDVPVRRPAPSISRRRPSEAGATHVSLRRTYGVSRYARGLMIVDDSQARRLARAILADIALYGGAGALDDPKAVAEGRELFAARVSGSLHHLFEEERRAHGGTGRAGSPGPTVEAGPAGVTITDGAGVGAGSAVAVGVALVVLVIAAATAFLLAR